MPADRQLEDFFKGSQHVAFSTWFPLEERVDLSGDFCRQFGIEPGELQAGAHRRLENIIQPDDLADAKEKLGPLFDGRVDEIHLEARLKNINGGWRSLFTHGRVAERDSLGFPLRIVCHHVDITDHKNYQRYKRLVNNAPIGVFVTLGTSIEEVIFTNNHLASLLGAVSPDGKPDRHAYRYHPLSAFMQPDDIRRIRRYAVNWRHQDIDRVERLASSLTTKLGTNKDTQITMSRDDWEGQDAWFFYVLDVTEVNRREFELERKNEALNALASTIAHDLSSPVYTMRTFLDDLETDAKSHPKKQFRDDFERVTKAAAKLDALLQGILDYSRAGRTDQDEEEISLRKEIERVKENLATEISSAGMTVQIERQLPTIYANRTRIFQLFQNLIQNSIRYRNPTESNPYVRVGTKGVGTERVFYVRDNGVGIDAASREKVFGLFIKLKKSSEGSGIGLAIVRRIVERYGGKIWIESNTIDGCGVEFNFTLPAVNAK